MRTLRWAVVVGLLTLASRSSSAFTFLNVPDRMDYAFDGNGVLYISTTGGGVLRYNTGVASFLSPFNIGGTLVGIDLSPDGQTLAVADSSTQGANNRIQLVNTTTGSATAVSFVRESYEAGTYMVAWGSDGQLLVTSDYSGSGMVPLRRYNPQTGTAATIAWVNQSSMLTPSADRNTIAVVENNSSNGPVANYDVPTQSITGRAWVNRFTFEGAVDRDGDKYVVPTYVGASVYDYSKSDNVFRAQPGFGQEDGNIPVAAVFSPVNDVLFTAEYGWSAGGGVRAYDAGTMSLLGTIDPYPFSWSGNHAMGEGRMEISPDGRFLAVSVDDGVRLYDVSAYVPEPSVTILLGCGVGALLRRRPRVTR